MKRIVIIGIFFSIVFGCKQHVQENNVQYNPFDFMPVINYKLVNTFPHDTLSFTEGFLFHNNQLFESTGSPAEQPELKSYIGIIDLKTGKVSKKVELDRKYFGEGIAFFNGKIYQLTYKSHIGFIYDAKTYKQLGTFSFQNKEGWGMTSDSTDLIMSDGSNILTYIDPVKLTPVKTLTVSYNGYAIDNLNELEYIKGFIFANIWTSNLIVKIDAQTGKIVGKIDLSSFQYETQNKYRYADVLNGIAYDPESQTIFITGKLWPNIYQLKLNN